MDINLQTGAPTPQPLPSAHSADTPAVKSTDNIHVSAPPAVRAPAPADIDITSAEEKRYQQLVHAAQSFFKDVYAVSDTTFTIFKDSTGQYITRFTNLRDGKVTYIPEPKILQYSPSQPRESLVEITA